VRISPDFLGGVFIEFTSLPIKFLSQHQRSHPVNDG